jgi:transposase
VTVAVSEVEIPHRAGSFDELRWYVGQYRSLHARAVEREGNLKRRVAVLEDAIKRQGERIAQQAEEIGALKAERAWLKQQIFGRKSEKTPATTDDGCPDDAASDSSGEPPERGRRGQRRGAAGHGRQNRRNPKLKVEEIEHALPADQQACLRCGLPFREFPGTEDSEEIHWEVRIVLRRHKRKRYQPTCRCGAVPVIITAPPPPKLIPKGMFSCEFWARCVLEKYLFQRPLHRTLLGLELEGLHVSSGTIVGGFQRLGPLLKPVYDGIVAHSHQFPLRKMDETRWLVFIPRDGKEGCRWWMWIDVTEETVVCILDASRSAAVLKNHLGDWEGILLVDCYSAYKAHRDRAAKLGIKILIAFCWSHRRRDFIEVGDGYARLRPWSQGWVERINELFAINRQRVQAPAHSPGFQEHDAKLRKALTDMAAVREQELADPRLHPVQRQVLECQRRHWDGLTLFADHPEVPMDNNESERLQRPEALGRKNYYGSGSLWSGEFSAHAFTIIQTLRHNGIDPQAWFIAYFKACAVNGGQAPESIAPWLPWNLSPEQKAAWQMSQAPP